MHVVIETPGYLADAKEAGLSEEERSDIVTHLAAHPLAGDLIEGTGGARKVRFAGRGKDKSGGYRVITFYTGEQMPVFLLGVFGKGDRVNISKAERNALRQLLGMLAQTYHGGNKP